MVVLLLLCFCLLLFAGFVGLFRFVSFLAAVGLSKVYSCTCKHGQT